MCQFSPENVPLVFGKNVPSLFGQNVPLVFGRDVPPYVKWRDSFDSMSDSVKGFNGLSLGSIGPPVLAIDGLGHGSWRLE
jgi:hypothetical protein